MKALLLLATPPAGVLALMFAVVVVLAPSSSTAGVGAVAGTCTATGAAASVLHLDSEQLTTAQAIITTGQALGVPARGWVIAIATGFQESGLRPLPYGDRDSLGVFQQREPWGPASVRMDPAASAQMFFNGGSGGQPGLLSLRGWADAPLTQAAQAVQNSAYPDAYAKWEPAAVAIVQQLTGADGGCHPTNAATPTPTPSAGDSQAPPRQ